MREAVRDGESCVKTDWIAHRTHLRWAPGLCERRQPRARHESRAGRATGLRPGARDL